MTARVVRCFVLLRQCRGYPARGSAKRKTGGKFMLYIFYGVDDPAKKHLRAELRETHFAYLEKFKGRLVLGGALLEDDRADNPIRTGSVLIVNFPSRAAAQDFVDNEPLSKGGLFKTMSLTRMRRGQWNPAVAPSTPEGN
jgi:uncharacterized protein YciI